MSDHEDDEKGTKKTTSNNSPSTTPSSTTPPKTLGKWTLLQKIGSGAFGEVWEARHFTLDKFCAVKVEMVGAVKKSVLKHEVAVLSKLQGSTYIPKFYGCGQTPQCCFCCMELLGKSLADLRRKQEDQKFSVVTVSRLAIYTLKGIEWMHDRGYLHRDVKPSNFVMKKSVPVIIDFGLARKYVDAANLPRTARTGDAVGFRGTARYASIHSHRCEDLCRRDDLWSWFFMLVEFLRGGLPWRKLKDKNDIGEIKEKYHENHYIELLEGLPPEFQSIERIIRDIEFEQTPPYEELRALLQFLLKSNASESDPPYDWEKKQSFISPRAKQIAAEDTRQRRASLASAGNSVFFKPHDSEIDVSRVDSEIFEAESGGDAFMSRRASSPKVGLSRASSGGGGAGNSAVGAVSAGETNSPSALPPVAEEKQSPLARSQSPSKIVIKHKRNCIIS